MPSLTTVHTPFPTALALHFAFVPSPPKRGPLVSVRSSSAISSAPLSSPARCEPSMPASQNKEGDRSVDQGSARVGRESRCGWRLVSHLVYLYICMYREGKQHNNLDRLSFIATFCLEGILTFQTKESQKALCPRPQPLAAATPPELVAFSLPTH